MNPLFKRAAKRPVGAAGVRAEKHTAGRLGAVQQPASGAMAGAKGDLTLGSFLLEAKSTVRDSLGLKFAWLAKIAGEARAVGRTPAVTVTFTTADGRPVADGSWVILQERVFREMTGLG